MSAASPPTLESAPRTPQDSPGLTRHQNLALAVIALTGLVGSLTQALLVPVLPELALDLHSSTGDTQWLLTSTLLVAAVAVPVFGRLGDLYGKKRMLLVAAAALTLGSLICGLSDSLGWLIVGRAETGLALPAIPLGISLIGSTLPAHRAGFGIALVSATLGIGGALGLPLAGLVAEHADYHWLFWICLLGGVFALVGTTVAVPEPPRGASGSMDVVGSVLLAGALVCLLLPLAQANRWGWADTRTIGLLVAAVVLLGVFVLVERRLVSPLVDMVTNARPSLLLTNIASLCVGFALFASLIGTASYVQAPEATGYGFGSSVLASGLCLLPSGLAMLALSPVSAKLTDRFGPKVSLALGASIVGIGFLSRIVLTGHLWEIILGTTIAGAGTGIAYAAMPGLILRAAPRSELAAANGLNTLARSVGSSLASAVGGTLLAANTIVIGGFALSSLSGYRILFALCAAAAIAGALIALVIPVSERSPEAATG